MVVRRPQDLGARLLMSGNSVDPRAVQGLALVPVVIEVALGSLQGDPLTAALIVGLLVMAVPTLLALLLGRRAAGTRWVVLIPVLDLLALGILRFAPQASIGVAMVLPAVWLAFELGGRGVALAGVVLLATAVVPTAYADGVTGVIFARAVQVTVVAMMAAATVALTSQMWRRHAADAALAHERASEAAADLVRQQRFTSSIVAGVNVGLVALDPQGRYESMNPRHQEFMALAFPDGHGGMAGQTGWVYGADNVTLLCREEMPTYRAARGEAFSDFLMWVGEEQDERRALAVSATPYDDDEGRMAGSVLAYHDVTDLVNALRVKDEFVASVSHELRTPLTSIIGYTDLILEEAEHLDPLVRRQVQTVQRNAHRLHRLVADLLSDTLQSVSSVLEHEPLDLCQVVAREVADARKVVMAAGLALDVELPDAPVCVLGDTERLEQVLDNLISNAVKYNVPRGQVRVTLTGDDRVAVLRVCDTGQGIAESDVPEVFGRFFRSHAVRSSAIPGAGLGLAITKSIVDAHGGSITVSSRLGEGTSFEVHLPVTTPAEPYPARTATPVA